jgi:hypothetical protein
MATDTIKRLHYYQRQYLGVEDLQAQQAYHRDMRRRHNLGHHTWGIVVGLELVEQPKEGVDAGVDVYVCPGMAIDGFGQEIVVLQPYQLDPVRFEAFTTSGYREIWIAYDEEHTRRPAIGYELCDVEDQFGRVRETFRIVVDPGQDTHDSIIVDGQPVPKTEPSNPCDEKVPPDLSIPYQEFPDDDTVPRWLVRLGSVHWDGVNRKFVEAAEGRLLEERRYVGNITAEVLAPAGALLVRGRHVPHPLPTDPTDPHYGGVAARLEGSLKVDRLLTAKQDVQIHGGNLDFRDSGGDSGESLFTVHREEDNGLSGIDLRVKIGEDEDGKNRFAVGPEVGGTFTEKLAVRDDGQVRIDGDLSISGVIDFDEQLGDRLMLWGAADDASAYGLGVESGTFYTKANQRHRWYVGANADGGASDVMELTSAGLWLNGRLKISGIIDFFDELGDRLMFYRGANDPTAYGFGIESGTLYGKARTRYRWYIGSNADDGASARMTLDNSGLSLSGRIDLSEELGDRLMLWGAAGAASAYGLGIESGTLYAKAYTRHRWYVGTNADNGTSAHMTLDADGLTVRLKMLELNLSEPLHTGEITLTSNQTSWQNLLTATSDAQAIISDALQAIYLEIKMRFWSSLGDSATLRIRSRGHNKSEREMWFEAALDVSDESWYENEKTFFLWLPKPSSTGSPLQYQLEGMGEDFSQVFLKIRIIGHM